MIETKFKDTEVGRIPEEWKIKQIGEACNTSSGGTPSRSNPEYYKGQIPWITTGELNDGYIIDSNEHITESAINNSAAKIVPSNTLLMAMYGATIGKLGILLKPSATNQACCAITPKSDEMKYLFYKLLADRCNLIAKGCGAGQPNISQAIIKELKYAFPPQAEQSRIASTLSNIDALISELDKLIEKKRAIKQGAMQELLTGKKRLANFQKPWTIFSLWQLTAWDKHFSEVEKDKQTIVYQYPYLLAADLEALEDKTGNVILLSTGNYSGTTTVEKAGKYLCEGEVVSIPWGGYANVKYTNGKFVTADNRIATSINISVLDNKFLYYYLLNNSKIINSFYRGASIKHPSMSDVLNMEILLPCISEQKAITSVLTKMDAELTQLESKHAKYQDIKQGMMQQLLTGKIRLI